LIGESRRYGAGLFPSHLNFRELQYSPHDYGAAEFGQSWFNSSTTPASLNAVWTNFWAYLSLQNIAPVWLGEFGTTNNNSDIQNDQAGSQGQWFQTMISFLRTNNQISWTYWALNGENRCGLLNSNYDPTPANSLKQQNLASIQTRIELPLISIRIACRLMGLSAWDLNSGIVVNQCEHPVARRDAC
jgi:endoglucanase